MFIQYKAPLVAMIMLVALAGCDAKKTSSAMAAAHTRQAASVFLSDPRAINLFPSATEVRLFVEAEQSGINGVGVVRNPNGRVLTPAQRADFEGTLNLIKMPTEAESCFDPHHFFRYYNHGNEIGEVAVCFCCSGVAVSGNANLHAGSDQILSVDYSRVKKLVGSMGEPTDVGCH